MPFGLGEDFGQLVNTQRSAKKAGLNDVAPEEIIALIEANPFLLEGKKLSKQFEKLKRRMAKGKGKKLAKRLAKRVRKRAGRVHKTESRFFAENELRDRLGDLDKDRKSFAKQRDRQIAGVEGQADRESRRFGGSLSQRIAKGFDTPATNFADELGRTVRASKARAGIAARGDAAIKNQQLRDRVSLARSGLNLRGGAMDVLASGANIREGVNLGVKSAKDFASAAQADAFGGLAGGIAAFIKGQRNQPLTGVTVTRKERSGSLAS